MSDNCPLCNLSCESHWYLETDDYVVCDCITCGVPMVVAKVHGYAEDEDLVYRCLRALRRVADEKYGEHKWRWREPRSIPQHWHMHAIPIQPSLTILDGQVGFDAAAVLSGGLAHNILKDEPDDEREALTS